MKDNKYEAYKKIFDANSGILRASTAVKLGIPEHVVYDMVRKGQVIKESRGLYRLAESEPLGNPDLVYVGLMIPKGVVFLISALYFHNLTTQIPHQIYIALPQSIKKPRIAYPPTKYFYLSKAPYEAGIEEHNLDGVRVRIYNKEKTVADCFKHRNQVGMDVALEALKDYLRLSSPNISLLMEYARIDRVERVMRPYVEALL